MAHPVSALSRAQMLPVPMAEMIKGVMPDIRSLLPPDIEYEKFRAALWLELTGNRQLKECTIDSIRTGAIKAATYGLLPGKFCHLLPFKNKGRLEATFIPNYFGVLLTLERSGKVAKAFAHPVYEGDEFTIDYFADEYHHIPYSVRGVESGAIRLYYGAVKMKDGTIHVEVMSLEQIEAVRKRAPAHDSGPWVTDRIAMSRKTALKAVAKYVHLTPEQKQMLDDDDEREDLDISPARQQKNVTDLFGDTTSGSTPTSEAPEAPADPRGHMGVSGRVQGPDLNSMWRETLEAHWQDMPEALREQCRAALEDLTTTESRGLELAGCVLDTLAHTEEGGS